MASQELKHRTRGEDEDIQPSKDTETTSITMNNSKTRRQKRTAMAKRGLCSLGLALVLPLSLTLLDISYFGCTGEPLWSPPLWAVHLAFLGSAFPMGLSAWLVWAEGGFQRNPTALLLYLGIAWDPFVFRAGASRVGLLFGASVGCARIFRSMKPIAGDLVKPCLLWALLLSLVNIKLVYM